MIAPESLRNKLIQVAREYLTKMQEGNYDAVWDTLVTPEAAKLLSTALFPVHIYKENKIDEILKPVPNEYISLSFDEAFAFAFQMDIQQIRTGFFRGMASAMENFGWFEVPLENSIAIVADEGAILIENSQRVPPLVLLFIRQEDGNHTIDFETLLLFSTPIVASSLYKIGLRAQEIGQVKIAISYFELAASFARPYSRIKRLMLDHPLVQKIITDARKHELSEEEKYILLARHQVLSLLSGPKVSSMPINMGNFLASTFKGYSCEPTVHLGHFSAT